MILVDVFLRMDNESESLEVWALGAALPEYYTDSRETSPIKR